jgi:glycosyltransferase involved in cell wall biosynthesis
MRVCLIATEIFAWGKYGGFGRATRMIGRELVKRGVEVSAVVPRRNEQKPLEELDGIRVLGFEMNNPLTAMRLFKEIDADIYHSEEPSFSTYLAQRAMPGRRHVITFRDTRDSKDWMIELRHPSLNRFQVLSNWVYEDNVFNRLAIHKADGLFTASRFLIAKAKKVYHLQKDPEFLPTPIIIPDEIKKSEQPVACYISRLDRRKRPELFCQLAASFPHVRFLAIGKSRDQNYDQHLRDSYSHLPNLEFLNFIDQFRGNELSHILGQSWILVNTSFREGLPNAFIEAAAHRCAILSSLDPDEFASRFGAHVQEHDLAAGLEALLAGDLWRTQGLKGYNYVRSVFSAEKAIDRHIRIYQELLKLA